MKYFGLLLFTLGLHVATTAQENWSVDNPHSNLRFEVGWEDFSMRTGEFKVFTGTIVTQSREDLSDAAFTFTVDASSVDVIAERLAGHIKSDRFLEVEKYPEITFVSSEVSKTGDGVYTAVGQLTIHGVEKTHEVIVKQKGEKATKKGYIMGLEVELEVNRTDFGLDWGSPRLGENIALVGHLLYKLQEEDEEE
ncbi:MAG: YceI family protein [Saprospiraceae bacterium]|nr:YceI family protein [Saprospiraceae bacterium]